MTDNQEERVLDRFILLEQLDGDTHRANYRARDMSSNREVVLTLFFRHHADDASIGPGSAADARRLIELDHPHLVSPYVVVQTDEWLGMAWDNLSGQTLARHLRERDRLAWDEMLAWLGPICAVLDHLHARGMVHGRLTPDDILIDPQHGPRLMHAVPETLPGRSDSTAGPVAAVNQARYRAPEVWQSGTIGPAADVYAIGCIAYELLLGQPLFRGATPDRLRQAHSQGPRFPTGWPEKLADEVEAILQRALAYDPIERYASAGAFRQALQDLTDAEAQTRAQRRQVSVVWSKILPLTTWLLITLAVLGLIAVVTAFR